MNETPQTPTTEPARWAPVPLALMSDALVLLRTLGENKFIGPPMARACSDASGKLLDLLQAQCIGSSRWACYPHDRGEGTDGVFVCECGRVQELLPRGRDFGCECGREFNSGGQLLAPREQWGEETGEHPADVARAFGHVPAEEAAPPRCMWDNVEGQVKRRAAELEREGMSSDEANAAADAEANGATLVLLRCDNAAAFPNHAHRPRTVGAIRCTCGGLLRPL